MTKGLNDEFYEHLHALDDRYGYALETRSGERCWVRDAKDDDPDLVFCQKYVQERFPANAMEAIEERFEDVFDKMVTTGPTTMKKLANMIGCTPAVARKLVEKHGLKDKYDKFQSFFHATVVHNYQTNEDIAALTLRDVIRYCGYNETNRPNVSRAKNAGFMMDHFSFEPMEKYIKHRQINRAKVEELYEQRITRIAE